jgi:hypothetical protein
MKLSLEERRARRVAKAIRLAYASLRSHLPYTFSGEQIRGETYAFHKKSVAEYATLIHLLSQLY